MHGPGTEAALRFAARVVADPARAVGQWKSLTGCKAVGCVPPIPVPEVLHAAGLLPVPCGTPDIPEPLRSRLDAWVVAPGGPLMQESEAGKSMFVFPPLPPGDVAAALDLLESLAEWAGVLSGRPVTEGGLWKSIRTYRERKELLHLLMEERAGRVARVPSAGDVGDIARAGDYLLPEAHSLLLARALRVPHPVPTGSFEEDREDPLLHLARRMTATDRSETLFSYTEP